MPRRWSAAAAVLGGYGVVVFAYLALPGALLQATPVDAIIRVASPLIALGSCLLAVLSLPAAAVGPWSLLSTGALTAGAAALLLPPPTTAPAHAINEVGLLLDATSYVLFAAGAAWLIHQRERARMGEILLDAALVVSATLVVLLRWTPAIRALPVDPAGGDILVILHTVVKPLAAVCALVFTGVLLVRQRVTRAGDFAASLAGAAAFLAFAAAPAAFHFEPFSRDVFTAATVAAWGFLTFAGVRLANGGAQAFVQGSVDPGGGRLRQAVAPFVAVTITVIVIEASLRPPMRQSTALAVAVLGLLLALRVNALLQATKHRSSERRQLAQSRALVEVSRALAGTTQLDGTLEQVSRWTCKLLNAEAAVLELLSEDGDSLEVRAGAGFATRMIGMQFPVEGTFTGWAIRHGESRATADPRFEPDIRPEARPLLGRLPTAVAPLLYHGRPLGALACVAAQPFDAEDMELLGALADQAAIAIENARLFEQVNTLSKTDPLTGLSNRRQLERDLAREFAAAERGRSLIAVMFDLNEFKEYNDLFGHLAGDEALETFGEVLRAETRAANLAARYGGDEFLTLLTGADDTGARVFVERIRYRFQTATAQLGRPPLTVAAGFASYDPSMTEPAALIAAADRALYRSKADRPRVG